MHLGVLTLLWLCHNVHDANTWVHYNSKVGLQAYRDVPDCLLFLESSLLATLVSYDHQASRAAPSLEERPSIRWLVLLAPSCGSQD